MNATFAIRVNGAQSMLLLVETVMLEHSIISEDLISARTARLGNTLTNWVHLFVTFVLLENILHMIQQVLALIVLKLLILV